MVRRESEITNSNVGSKLLKNYQLDNGGSNYLHLLIKRKVTVLTGVPYQMDYSHRLMVGKLVNKPADWMYFLIEIDY